MLRFTVKILKIGQSAGKLLIIDISNCKIINPSTTTRQYPEAFVNCILTLDKDIV